MVAHKYATEAAHTGANIIIDMDMNPTKTLEDDVLTFDVSDDELEAAAGIGNVVIQTLKSSAANCCQA